MMDIVERLRWEALTSNTLVNEQAANEIERLRGVMEKVADVLYDKGDYECWAALRNVLWQQGNKE